MENSRQDRPYDDGDDDEQQHHQQSKSPFPQPASPTLRPQSRPPPAPRLREAASSSSAAEGPSSKPAAGPTTPRSPTSPGAEAEGSRSASSTSSSRSSRSSIDGGSTGPKADDLSASVISTLDLDAETGASDADADADADAETSGQSPAPSPRPPPLVREDTSTREAMAQLDLPGQHMTTDSGDAIQLLDHTADSSASTPSGAPQPPLYGLDVGTPASDPSTVDTARTPHGGDRENSSFDSYYWQPEDNPASSDVGAHADMDAHTHASVDASGSAPASTDPAPHDPKTTASRAHEPDTVPTVSATGMPRMFLPRHTDDPTRQDHVGSEGPPPREMLPEGSGAAASTRKYAGRPRVRRRHRPYADSDADADSDSDSDADLDSELDFASRSRSSSGTESRSGSSSPTPQPKATDAPTGSLTLAALSPSSGLTLRRRAALLSASLLINLGLPFINGVMLGFGEIFARSVVAPVVLGFIGRSNWGVGLGLGTGGVGLGVGAAGGGGATSQSQSQSQRERDREVMREVAGSGRGVGPEGAGVRAA